MKILPRRLFARSLLIIITPIILLQLIVSFVFFDRHLEAVTNRLASAIASEIHFIIQLRAKPIGISETELAQLALQTTNLTLQFVGPKGSLPEMGARQQTIFTRMLGRAMKENLPYPVLVHQAPNSHDIQMVVVLPDSELVVGVPLRRVFTATTYVVVWWLFGAALILMTIAILFLRNQIRPIHRLAIAADHFGKGLDNPSFRPEGATEIRRAATAFIQMRDRIKRQIQQRTEILAGVSHDLRTPLTRMKLQLALLRDQHGLNELHNDIHDMEVMIEAYLDFARGEGGEDSQSFNLTHLITHAIENSRRLGANITLLPMPDCPYIGRKNALQRMLENILGNCQRYATHCTLAMHTTEDIITITIDDNGPGIPAPEREDVFRPFFRREQSRNMATGGVGLGLTIARDIARNHGGDIILADTQTNTGLRTIITLPV